MYGGQGRRVEWSIHCVWPTRERQSSVKEDDWGSRSLPPVTISLITQICWFYGYVSKIDDNQDRWEGLHRCRQLCLDEIEGQSCDSEAHSAPTLQHLHLYR